jgi:glycosyltransferase involved in cell wall biosynthesis
MSDTVVFIPAWNEEENLPAVLDDLRRELPDADVLVVDDGSTDGTVEVARRQGAEVLSLGSNRGLPIGIAAGYRWALDHGYAYCGRVDADGQHPSKELKRLLAIVREGEYDVAVGSRFVSGDGYEPYRYVPSPARRLGTALLRRGMRLALRRPFADATSGLYAVNGKALPLLAEPFRTEAPEVEALIRLSDAGLRVAEVPVRMEQRVGGDSKLRGRKAVKVIATVVGTLVAAKLLSERRSASSGYARLKR